MERVLVIVQKEWLEMRQQRGLLLSVFLPPLFFMLIPAVALFGTSFVSGGSASTNGGLPIPALVGMTPKETGQAIIGLQFSILYILSIPVKFFSLNTAS